MFFFAKIYSRSPGSKYLNLAFSDFFPFLPLYFLPPTKEDHGQCFLVVIQEKAALGR
jgi:hypothetical protein